MTHTPSLIIDKILSEDDSLAKKQTLEILEGYEKISDIISRTHMAMGRNQEIKITTACSGSDKILAYVQPSTH